MSSSRCHQQASRISNLKYCSGACHTYFFNYSNDKSGNKNQSNQGVKNTHPMLCAILIRLVFQLWIEKWHLIEYFCSYIFVESHFEVSIN